MVQTRLDLNFLTLQPQKNVVGNASKVFLTGVLEHDAPRRRLALFTMAEEYGTENDHFIESIYCFINSRKT